ncbi:MAG: acetolactate synthase large subunit, partial [Lachnospiraceae bacterium]|nr:acetolactate synthase large subunit [Lachnospiraceae bacterium]
KLTKGNAIITTEVGQHQMWAAQHYHYRSPRTFLSSGGLGTMGYGLGACIGAKCGKPDKVVVNIAGDGCFRMNMNELATASRYNIPIIEIVFNNHVLGMVRQWQDLFYGKRFSQTTLNDKVDFIKVAQGLGVTAFKLEKAQDVEKVLKEALAVKGPVFIEAVIDSDDKVWPMVAPGAAISEVFDKTDLK